jgi:uncharacterized protein
MSMLTQDPNPTTFVPKSEEEPSPRGLRRFFAIFRRILQIDDSPESIALGVALGIFIAMTPTVGIQMILVVIVHTIVKANRMSGIAMCYISNPFTMLPIYWFDYQVGRFFLGQATIKRETFDKIFQLEGPNILVQLQSFVENLARFSWDVAGPLCLGGLIVGAFCGLPAYPITLRLIRRHRANKAAAMDVSESKS